jgi:hypothetical protein
MAFNTSAGMVWNAPSYVEEFSISPHTPPPTSPEDDDEVLQLIHSFGAPPTPIPAEPLVLALQDAREVDLLAITNGFDERRIKQEFSSTESDDGDGSVVIASEDSERSGLWYEYIKGKKMGMDLEDSFIDDSDINDISFSPL